jgi:branched-chain amino acid transport system substrate-binding protein
MKNDTSRRDWLRYAGAGILGAAIGASATYGTSPERYAERPTGPRTKGVVPTAPIKLGIVSWFSGPSAMVGEACYNSAIMAADAINAGGGILGRRLEVIKRDAGAPDVTVEAVRRFVLEDKVDLMAGDIGGSNANAITPNVEQLKVPFFLQCSTTVKMVEELDPNPLYLFRSGEQNLAEPIVAAQIISTKYPDAKRIAGINPDYVYGREAMGYTMMALGKLAPHMESVLETWPPLFATDYTTHITSVLNSKPDIVLTACWGGDFVTLCKQGTTYGLFEKTHLVSIIGAMALNSLTKDILPEGVDMLQRDYYFLQPPHNLFPLNKWFVEEYHKRFNKYPEFDCHQMFSAIMAYKQGVERAYDYVGGWPENEDICKAIQGTSVVGPGGYRAITNDGQFLNPLPYGTTKHDPNYPIVTLDPATVGFVPVEAVYNPKPVPPILKYRLGTGMTYSDWMDSW